MLNFCVLLFENKVLVILFILFLNGFKLFNIWLKVWFPNNLFNAFCWEEGCKREILFSFRLTNLLSSGSSVWNTDCE